MSIGIYPTNITKNYKKHRNEEITKILNIFTDNMEDMYNQYSRG